LRELIRTCLERVGYRVHVAASGEEALAAARENPERIHLVVTDVVLPGIGGRQLAAQLSELRPRLRVLFVSGYTDNAIVHNQILDAGVAFLQKPFLPKDLLRRVRAVLDAGEAPRI
jgi:DNA-binding response OmpR family regulator